MGGSSSWLLVPLQVRVQWSQAHHPFHCFRSIIFLHRSNDISVVVLTVFSRGESNLPDMSSFPICQNSGKPRSLWVEISLLCKAPAPDCCWVWNCTPSFPFCCLPSFSLYVDMILYYHSSFPWLYECMNFIIECIFIHADLQFAFQELLCHATCIQTFEEKWYN